MIGRALIKTVCFVAVFQLILCALSLEAVAQTNLPAPPDSLDTTTATEPRSSNLGTIRVIVTGFEVEGGGIKAGTTSKIVYNIKNMSTSTTVYSVLVAWWTDGVAPLEFIETNQAFVPIIGPQDEVQVEFTVRAKSVDLTSTNAIGSSLAISYSAPGQSDRTNNVMIQLPVYHDNSDPVKEAPPMFWQMPSDRKTSILSSRLLQIVYLLGFVACSLGVVVMIFWRRIHYRL